MRRSGLSRATQRREEMRSRVTPGTLNRLLDMAGVTGSIPVAPTI